MKVDVEQFAQELNQATKTIKEAAEAAQKNPLEAMTFITNVLAQLKEIRNFGDSSHITASVTSETQKRAVYQAVESFLTQTKEAQEKAGSLGAGFFANPFFQNLKDNLEQVKTSLEKGKRVEKSSESQEI